MEGRLKCWRILPACKSQKCKELNEPAAAAAAAAFEGILDGATVVAGEAWQGCRGADDACRRVKVGGLVSLKGSKVCKVISFGGVRRPVFGS